MTLSNVELIAVWAIGYCYPKLDSDANGQSVHSTKYIIAKFSWL